MFASSVLTNEILMSMVDKTNASAAGIARGQAGVMGATYETGFDLATGLAGSAAELVEKSEDKLVTLSNQMNKFDKMQRDFAGKTNFAGKQGAADVTTTRESLLTGHFDFANESTAGEKLIKSSVDKMNASFTAFTEQLKNKNLTFN